MSLDPTALEVLCAAALPDESLTEPELTHVCYGAGDHVVGDERGAVAFTMKHHGADTAVWILLVAVHPAHQARGLGRDLVGRALDEAAAYGARRAHLANAVPRYLWPGVDVMNTRAGMLFESLGFSRDLIGINMTIPSSFRRAAPRGVTIERENGSGALEFAQRAYPHWTDELAVAVERGTAYAARDASGATIGFGCHSCNRSGWIGPMATDPQAQHRGVGSAVLAAVCADLERRGHRTGEIAWVSNLRFYGKCGATVSRVFQGGHRAL